MTTSSEPRLHVRVSRGLSRQVDVGTRPVLAPRGRSHGLQRHLFPQVDEVAGSLVVRAPKRRGLAGDFSPYHPLLLAVGPRHGASVPGAPEGRVP